MRSAGEAYDIKLTSFARALKAAKTLGYTPMTIRAAANAANSSHHDSTIRLTTAKQNAGRPTVLTAKEETGHGHGGCAGHGHGGCDVMSCMHVTLV